MKKSIIVLALALLMVGSVFAATYNPVAVVADKDADDATRATTLSTATSANKNTQSDVVIQLHQYPIYVVAVTEDDLTGKVTNTNYSTDVKHVSEIELEADKDTWIIEDSKTYYFTWFFYENTENVKFTVELEGDMKLQDNTTATGDNSDNAKTTIRYQVNIKSADYSDSATDETKDVTLTSSGTSAIQSAIIKRKPATNLIGDYDSKSYAFTVTRVGDETVQNNIVGKYKSDIKLTIESYT